MFIKLYLSFIIQVKEEKYRIFWGIRDVQTDDSSSPSTADTWTDRIVNITELLQVFKLMTILFKVLLILQTDGSF